MTEIEFLTPDAPPEPSRAPRPATVQQWAPLAAVGFSALGALLAVLAPSQLVYEFRIGNGLGGNAYRPDGWGRLPQDEGGDAQHGLRYGIVVCIAAGLLVLAAALLVAYRTRPAEQGRLRLPLAAAAAAVGAVAVLGAVVSEVLLAMQSLRDNITAQLDVESTPGARGSAVHTELSVGAMVWLIVLAAGCGLVALLCTGLAVRSSADGTADVLLEPAPADEPVLDGEPELI